MKRYWIWFFSLFASGRYMPFIVGPLLASLLMACGGQLGGNTRKALVTPELGTSNSSGAVAVSSSTGLNSSANFISNDPCPQDANIFPNPDNIYIAPENGVFRVCTTDGLKKKLWIQGSITGDMICVLPLRSAKAGNDHAGILTTDSKNKTGGACIAFQASAMKIDFSNLVGDFDMVAIIWGTSSGPGNQPYLTNWTHPDNPVYKFMSCANLVKNSGPDAMKACADLKYSIGLLPK